MHHYLFKSVLFLVAWTLVSASWSGDNSEQRKAVLVVTRDEVRFHPLTSVTSYGTIFRRDLWNNDHIDFDVDHSNIKLALMTTGIKGNMLMVMRFMPEVMDGNKYCFKFWSPHNGTANFTADHVRWHEESNETDNFLLWSSNARSINSQLPYYSKATCEPVPHLGPVKCAVERLKSTKEGARELGMPSAFQSSSYNPSISDKEIAQLGLFSSSVMIARDNETGKVWLAGMLSPQKLVLANIQGGEIERDFPIELPQESDVTSIFRLSIHSNLACLSLRRAGNTPDQVAVVDIDDSRTGGVTTTLLTVENLVGAVCLSPKPAMVLSHFASAVKPVDSTTTEEAGSSALNKFVQRLHSRHHHLYFLLLLLFMASIVIGLLVALASLYLCPKRSSKLLDDDSVKSFQKC